MKELTCISCPLGCNLRVCVRGGEIEVSGNGCPRGEKYAKNEITAPKRSVTSTVAVEGGTIARVSVKTETEVPKGKIMDCMAEIRRSIVKAPVKIGSVIIEDCAGTGVRVIATKNVDKRAG